MRLLIKLAPLLIAASVLAACAGPQPEAHIPATGISGNSGGSVLTITYDKDGNPHFQG